MRTSYVTASFSPTPFNCALEFDINMIIVLNLQVKVVAVGTDFCLRISRA